MSFDLKILCLMEQERCRGKRFMKGKRCIGQYFSFSSKLYFYLVPKRRIPLIGDGSIYTYGRWAFLSTCMGYCYGLLPKEDEDEQFPGLSGCYDVCKSHCTQQCLDDFKIWKDLPDGEDYPKFDNLYDKWMYHKNVSLETLEIKQEYREDFGKIIDYFLERSPVKMIIFLPRYQGDERDNVEGVLKRDLFFEMLDTGKIKFNTCYIISNIDDDWEAA